MVSAVIVSWKHYGNILAQSALAGLRVACIWRGIFLITTHPQISFRQLRYVME
jgi:hypothetical protein